MGYLLPFTHWEHVELGNQVKPGYESPNFRTVHLHCKYPCCSLKSLHCVFHTSEAESRKASWADLNIIYLHRDNLKLLKCEVEEQHSLIKCKMLAKNTMIFFSIF